MNTVSLDNLIVRNEEVLPLTYIKFHRGEFINRIYLSKSILKDCNSPTNMSIKVSKHNNIYVAINPNQHDVMCNIGSVYNNEYIVTDDRDIVNNISKFIHIDTNKFLILPLHKIYRNHNTVIYIINGSYTEIAMYPFRSDFNSKTFNHNRGRTIQ